MRKCVAVFLLTVCVLIALTGFGAAKIKLTVWDWSEPRIALFKEFAQRYQALHPNVEFEFSLTDWSVYWSKLSVAITAGSPPDIAQFHNEQADRFVDHNLLAPFPQKLFNLAEYDRRYVMFRPAFLINGNMYYHPSGIMTPAIYYNKDLLSAAGFDRVPDTWSDMISAAKKLTRKDADGRMQQVGFQFGGSIQYLFTDLVYQNGGYLFKADNTGVDYGSTAGKSAVNLIEELVAADITDERAGIVSPGTFEAGKVAMKYNWTWYNGSLVHYPSLNWGVAMLPTLTGSSYPARGRNNYECGLAVPATVPAARQEEAFKFIKWLYDNDEFAIRINLLIGRVPGRKDLWMKQELYDDPVYQLLIEQAPYTVYPGPLPSWIFSPVLATMQDRIRNGEMAPQVALELAVQEGNVRLQEIPPKYIVERLYQPPH
jgi:multiple sugar transport system substrate-binding protein